MRSLGPLVEGKMFGVLLVDSPEGQRVLRAFSGLLNGQASVDGWVPPIATQTSTPLEQHTLARLSELKAELIALADSPDPHGLRELEAGWADRRQQLDRTHDAARAERDGQRSDLDAAERLDRASRAESLERRELKRAERADLEPWRERVRLLQQRVLDCKHERRRLSRALQAELHASFEQCLFPGEPWSLASLFPDGPPTGVGECCAPRLLHYAARQGWRPLGLAEFWWGPPPPAGGRQPGQFYGACQERCQPLIGPLLAGFGGTLQILHQDAELLVVDKPAGVLSVPGRQGWNQDSVLTRLRERFPELLPVHRLDMETSGVLVFARTSAAQVDLQAQFAAQTVRKCYQARLEGCPSPASGVIELALGRNPSRSGCYLPDPAGRAARTRYRLLDRERCRVEFWPETGRSHQIRVHAAHWLGCPIQGDRLYGTPAGRLLLHAWRLQLTHPITGVRLNFESSLQF